SYSRRRISSSAARSSSSAFFTAATSRRLSSSVPPRSSDASPTRRSMRRRTESTDANRPRSMSPSVRTTTSTDPSPTFPEVELLPRLREAAPARNHSVRDSRRARASSTPRTRTTTRVAEGAPATLLARRRLRHLARRRRDRRHRRARRARERAVAEVEPVEVAKEARGRRVAAERVGGEQDGRRSPRGALALRVHLAVGMRRARPVRARPVAQRHHPAEHLLRARVHAGRVERDRELAGLRDRVPGPLAYAAASDAFLEERRGEARVEEARARRRPAPRAAEDRVVPVHRVAAGRLGEIGMIEASDVLAEREREALARDAPRGAVPVEALRDPDRADEAAVHRRRSGQE